MNAENRVRSRWCPFSLPLCLVLATTGLVLIRPVRGAKPAPPPPDRPVNYRITWLDSLERKEAEARDINSRGHAVGTVRNWDPYDKYNYVDQIAIAYDRDFDLALDGVVDGDVIDLNAVVTEFLGEDTQGWSLAEAFAINGSDQIVGRATRQFPGQAEESRGFVTDATWTQCYLLPWPSGRSGQIAKRINSTGVVVAQEGDDYSETMSKFATNGQVTVYTWDGSAYQPTPIWPSNNRVRAINDNGQILLEYGLRYTPDSDQWEDFATTYGVIDVQGMNNVGTFVGARNVGRKRNCCRYTDATGMLDIAAGGIAWDVNSDGDVCLSPSSNRGQVYTNLNKLWSLDNLVVDETPEDVAMWTNAAATHPVSMTDDQVAGFGAIAGWALFSTTDKGTVTQFTRAFVLTPVLPPSPFSQK